MRYKQREIVLVPFPYSDLRTTKRRPVLILSNDDYNDNFEDVLVCVITSNRFRDEYSIDLNDTDLEMGFLPEPSVIKVHKLFTIHQKQIVKKFSLLKVEVFQRVVRRLSELVES